MTSDGGRKTVSYLVRCALAAGDSIVKQDDMGNNFTFNGSIGLAPQYKTAGCGKDCLEMLSSCLMAHVNTTGVHIPLWLDSPMSAIGWGQSPSFPTQEGTFFGQIFLTNTSNNLDAYYCNGSGVSSDVVPGRLGSALNSASAPYANAYPTSGGLCNASKHCTMQASGDGAVSCVGNGTTWQHPITVWRGQTFQAENGVKSGGASTISCSTCGAGARVGKLSSTSKVTFNGVSAATTGANNLVVYYTNGDSARHWFNIQVNGGASQLIQFDPSGSSSTVLQKPVTLTGFKAGTANTVAFMANGSDSPPDLDWIEVIGATNDYCDRSRWLITATNSSVQDPPLNALDEDPDTRWSSGRDMDGTDEVIVDFGGTVKISSINMLLAGYDSDDFPDSYALYGSNDGVKFSSSSFTSSSGSVTETKSFSTQTLRAVKIKQTGSNKGRSWSINDLDFSCSM
jgi:F5/8 type C domain/Alpha-galactosidase, CBM13 domain